MFEASREKIIKTLAFERVAENTIMDEQRYREELESVRQQGYAIAYREHQSDVCGVAASIRDFRGEVAGALSISAPCLRADVKKLRGWGPMVCEATTRVSQKLGWLP